MNQNANHPEGQGPQGREHLPKIPREQFESIRLRWEVRQNAGQYIYDTFRNTYVPQSLEVTQYQEQQAAAQRNLGANVVQAAAQPGYYTNQAPQYPQPTPEAQPVAPATPVAASNVAHTPVAAPDNRDYINYITQETPGSTEPAIVDMGNGVATAQDNLNYLAQEANSAMAPVDAGDIDIEAVRQQIREMA